MSSKKDDVDVARTALLTLTKTLADHAVRVSADGSPADVAVLAQAAAAWFTAGLAAGIRTPAPRRKTKRTAKVRDDDWSPK